MHLEHSLAVDGSVGTAWRALIDPGVVARCVPDASVTSVDAGVAEGRLRIRFGSLKPTFRATARVVERNSRAHRIVVELGGDDIRGGATIAARVVATVRRAGDATVVRIEADVELTGRPAELSKDRQRAATAAVIDQFLTRLSEPPDKGDDVADQPAENPPVEPDAENSAAVPAGSAAPRKRPRPTPGSTGEVSGAAPVDDPTVVEPAPDLPPVEVGGAGSDGDSTPESSIETAAESIPAFADPAIEAAVESFPETADTEPATADDDDIDGATAPSFGTPGGIRVPTLDDEPSVNGHSPSAPLRPESPLAVSTRQAVAKRFAPAAVGLLFILAAARRRRGKRA